MSNGNWGGSPPVYRSLTLNGDPPSSGASPPPAAPTPPSSSPQIIYRLVPSQPHPPTPLSDPSSRTLTVNIWTDGTQPWLNTGAVLPPWSKYAVSPSMTLYELCTRMRMPLNDRSWQEGWGVAEVVLLGPDERGLPCFGRGRVWRVWQDSARKVEEMGRGADGEVWLACWTG